MKKPIFIKTLALISLTAFLLIGCSNNNNNNGTTATPTTSGGNNSNVNSGEFKDGTYQVEDKEYENGYRNVLTLKVNNDKITEVTWDALDEDGTGKRQLSLEGEYIMTEDGLKWIEQSDLLEDYVIKNQSTKDLKIDDDGKTDVISGVSIDISDFIRLVDEAMEKAKK